MKQVTMESICQRIADLESAGKVVGGLSLSSEFELACLRELVAATEQRDALVAAMQLLKTAHPQPFGPEMMKALDAYELHQDDVPETGMLNAFFILRNSIRIDATTTDAARASLRAEGVEMFAAQERAIAARRKSNGVDDCFIKKILETAENAEEFAKELRESKGEVSNG